MARIYLSPPDVGIDDQAAIQRAVESGWIAPLGPEVDGLEAELAAVTTRRHGVALSSGTAALHLGLLALGVGPGDRVLVSSLTFAATANAVRYTGAEPVFVDSDRETWNMDPDLLGEALESEARFAACVPVDIYGQCADYDRIEALCAEHEVPLIEDAAEALGATYRGRRAGSFGVMATLSFNGNKIITTSGGGALVTDREDWAGQTRWLATQARDPAPHYEHTTIGYNYRLSNLLAALGRSQLADLERRVDRRREHNQFYREALGDLPGVDFMPEADGCRSTFWLTCVTVDPVQAGTDREQIRLHLESLDIEARPVWKPMHLQPVFSELWGGGWRCFRRPLRARPLPAQWVQPQRPGPGTGGQRSAGSLRLVKPILTAEEYRRVDQGYAGDLDAAMDHAGLAVALAAVRHGAGYGKRVVVLAGPGNNGGDGYVAARYLARRGVDVVVHALADPKTPEAVRAAGLARATGIEIVSMGPPEPADLIIDAVFGGGGRSELPPVLGRLDRLPRLR